MPPNFCVSSEDEEGTNSSVDFDQIWNSCSKDQSAVSPKSKRPRRLKSGDGALPLAKKSSLQPKEIANLFYLSLIEDRCRIQAAKSMNAQRSKGDWLPNDHPKVQELCQRIFKQTKKELLKVGIITQEKAEESPDLDNYLRTFDTFLHNIAASKENQNVSFVLENPGALVRRKVSDHELGPTTYSLVSLNPAKIYPQSVYCHQYEEMSLLGSGGEGAVYKARDKIDMAMYAIKKVVIPAKKLRHLQRKSVPFPEKLKEVYALAKLNHPNVVRYHHSWIEHQKSGSYITFKREGGYSSSSSSSESGRDESHLKSQSRNHTVATSARGSTADGEVSESASKEVTSSLVPASYSEADESISREIEELRFGFSQQDLTADLDQTKDEAYDEELVIFGYSSNAKPEIEDKRQPKYASECHNKPRQWFEGPTEYDAILYIKMTAYSSTLDALLRNGNNTNMIPQHCFHTLPTTHILIAIIDGLQYIHRKGIIHQDIKPGNIFLSVLEPGEPATPAYVNVTNCPDCVATGPIRPLYICLHIGDFGMIKDIESGLSTDQALETDEGENTPNDSSKKLLYSNISAYKAGDSFLAGTGFYKPPWIRGIKPIICPKRDCYALGAVALEMICRFDSKSERVHVFSQLREHGVFPQEVRDHKLGECIMGMLQADREKRWSLERVKNFLVDMREGCIRETYVPKWAGIEK